MLQKLTAILMICVMTLSLPADVLAETLTDSTSEVVFIEPTPEIPEATQTPAEQELPEKPETTHTPEPSATQTPSPEATATAEPPQTPDIDTGTPAPTESPSEEDEPNEPQQITISLETEKLIICAGDWFELKPEFSDGAAHEYSFAISDESVLQPDENGRFSALEIGAAELKFISAYGEASCCIEVIAAPTELKISVSADSLKVGESAIIQLEDVAADRLNTAIFSSDESVAAVDSQGRIIAIAPGECTITIEAFNGVSGSAVITVYAEPTMLTLSESSLSLRIDKTFTLSAQTDTGNTDGLVWSSSDESIAICTNGTIQCTGIGECEIRATLPNGLSAVCTVAVKAAPEAVTLPYSTLKIGVGESVQLEPDTNGAEAAFSYKSSKTKYAKVSSDGVVKGVKKGTAVIRVRTDNGKETSVTVKVCTAPKKVTASPKSLTLGVGETATVSYTLPKNTAGSVTFASNNEDVVIVDPISGIVTAIAPGEAKVRVRTFNKKDAFVTVKVKNAPESVSLSPEVLTIGVGQIITMSAALNDDAAGKITLHSSDNNLLAVSGSKIKGIAEGAAEIAAVSYNGLEARASVTIVPAPKKVTLPYKTLTIGVGESMQLTPDAGEGISGFTYRSKSTKYVTVDANGVVKGKRKGSSKVYVKTYNGKEAYVTVKVIAAPKAVKASVSKLDLSVGQTGKIGYTLPSGTAGSVTYSSSDPAVASVNTKTGEVIALAQGEAEITLRTFNGKTAKCTVRVYSAPDSISVNVQALELGVGQTFQLEPTLPENTLTSISYSTSDAEIVTVSASGIIIAVGKGSAIVRVQTHVPEVYAEVPVEVGDAPQSVHVEQNEMTLLLGEAFRIEPVIPQGSKSTFNFDSSHPEIASVDADGMVTTLDVGSTLLTVSTYNGKTASIRLKVWHPSYPEKITLTDTPDVVNLKDGGFTLECIVEPETAAGNIRWESSNPASASVDENGVVTLHDYGYAVISAVSAKNPSIRAEFTLTIQMENLALTIPKRITKESGIKANLALIQNIRSSAIAQIDALEKGGVISASDANKRRSIIRNIFKDYAFAWKTPSYQPYWKEANSEGGVKDFKPGQVYYGMPYISGSDGNNRYTLERAIENNRFTDSGKGYYLLNRKNLRNGKYVGNDCSALVNAAIWGIKSSHMYDNTATIFKSKSYKTIKDTAQMRPGDLLCLSGRHVVMFLYYANPEKTKIMIIENGGEEAGTNTVHCAVHDLSYYTDLKYQVRRLKTLG